MQIVDRIQNRYPKPVQNNLSDSTPGHHQDAGLDGFGQVGSFLDDGTHTGVDQSEMFVDYAVCVWSCRVLRVFGRCLRPVLSAISDPPLAPIQYCL